MTRSGVNIEEALKEINATLTMVQARRAERSRAHGRVLIDLDLPPEVNRVRVQEYRNTRSARREVLDVEAENDAENEAREEEGGDDAQEREAAVAEAIQEAPVEPPPSQARPEIIFARRHMLPPPRRDEDEMPGGHESSSDNSLNRMFKEIEGRRQRVASVSAEDAPQPEDSEESLVQEKPEDKVEQEKESDAGDKGEATEEANAGEEKGGSDENMDMDVDINMDAGHEEEVTCSEDNVTTALAKDSKHG